MSAFDQAFELLIGHEGGFTDHRADPGNWTGGKVGSGTLKGTKLGISAASFPTLDILALTLDDARAIYRRLYWDRVHGDQLPPALALLVFDAAVNNGVARAARLLQAAIGTPDDGLIGTGTMAALARPEQRQPRPGGHGRSRVPGLLRRLHGGAVDLVDLRPGLGAPPRLLPFQAMRLAS